MTSTPGIREAGVVLSPVTHSYTELAGLVRGSGLMRRRYGWYWSRMTAAVTAFAAVLASVVVIGNSWWQMVPAVLLGLVLTQFGFLGHDASHRQIFATARWNDWTARILAGAFAGLSYGWWRGKHSRHHARPNQVGHDPDIASGVLAFTRETVPVIDIAGGRIEIAVPEDDEDTDHVE